MTSLVWIAVIGIASMLSGCAARQAPQAKKSVIETKTLSCEEANQLAYQAVTTLGYSVAAMQVATAGQAGTIEAKKEGASDGKVTITCASGNIAVEPERAGVPLPSLKGKQIASFPQLFTQTFNILLMQKGYAPQQGATLTMTMTRLNNFESQMELGSDLPASGVLPVKVVITNHTSRPYGLDTGKVFLMAEGGRRVAPVAPPAAGRDKALQGELTIAPGQVVTGYLFYPSGAYSSARTTLIDKETDEGEGFSVQF